MKYSLHGTQCAVNQMLNNTNKYKEQLDDLQKISEEISDLIYDKKYNKIYLLDKKRKNIIKSLHTNLKDKNVLNCLYHLFIQYIVYFI